MADLVVGGDLKNKFSQFHDIASVTASLQSKLDQINLLNKQAAGKDDEFAESYHKQIDKPTEDMVSLLGSVRDLFSIKGDNGSDAVDLLSTGDDDATEAASSL